MRPLVLTSRTLQMVMLALWLTLGAGVTGSLSHRAEAAIDAFEFESDEQERRFRQMSNDFRCPIYLMIMDGKTDYEIEQFMLERYGDFIFYRPRLMTETLLLWFGPLAFLLLGGWIIAGIIRRARPQVQEKVVLNEEEQERLRTLLDGVKRE